jgi:hypothetical protein
LKISFSEEVIVVRLPAVGALKPSQVVTKIDWKANRTSGVFRKFSNLQPSFAAGRFARKSANVHG